jgi:hypothetical protein
MVSAPGWHGGNGLPTDSDSLIDVGQYAGEFEPPFQGVIEGEQVPGKVRVTARSCSDGLPEQIDSVIKGSRVSSLSELCSTLRQALRHLPRAAPTRWRTLKERAHRAGYPIGISEIHRGEEHQGRAEILLILTGRQDLITKPIQMASDS